MESLSDLARRGRRTTVPAGVEANVRVAPESTTDMLFVRVDGEPGYRRGPFPWVSQGRMPIVGDGALVLTGARGERWVLVWGTGDPIGS